MARSHMLPQFAVEYIEWCRVLGVATIAYLPFNFFCWLSPIVTMIFGLMGWTIQKIEDDPDTVQDFAAMDADDQARGEN